MRRSESSFINMRKTHNRIKADLIRQTAAISNSKRLLDVSIGRFGDLHNCINAGITYVLGLDPDEKSIEEAKSRLKNYSDKITADLKVSKITDCDVDTSEKFKIVCCNFTLHYFFESETFLRNALRNISRSMTPGGYFIGTSIDTVEKFNDTSEHYIIDKTVVSKLPIENRDKNPFGRGYKFKLIDNKESGNYFNDTDSIEYLVDIPTFVSVAREYGLNLVKMTRFSDLNKNLENHEKRVSDLYFSFVFFRV